MIEFFGFEPLIDCIDAIGGDEYRTVSSLGQSFRPNIGARPIAAR